MTDREREAGIDSGHGFHVNGRGQTRYAISPGARREILRRLLALNLEIAAREAAKTDTIGRSMRERKKR